ncbi:vacuolar protein sorting 41, partial [Pelomyxa schiedti]
MFKGAADAVKRATAGLTTAPATKKSAISGTDADSSSPTIAYSGGASSYVPQQRPVVAATQQPAAPTQQQATSTPGAAVHSTPADAVGLSSTTSPQPAVGTATAPVLQATAQVLRDSTPACTATQTTPGGAAYSTPSASPAVQSLGLPSVGSALTTGVLPESDSNNDDEWEEDEEEVEPQLKSNNASCIAIYAKFLALGTHTGKIFILDFQGNQLISFESHDYTVNEISIDGTGHYLASCSDDGRVVINALMAKEVITCEYHRPIKAVSIDPNYIRKNTRQYCVGGSSGHLMVNVKGILKAKDVVIHQGQGAIHTIKWKGQFIAWASDTGIRVWDVSSRQQIGAIPREPGSPRPDLYRCCLCWEDERTLIIGWADGVKICEVKERPPTDQAGFFLQITAKFKTDFFISGVAPYGTQLVLLAYIEENTDPEGRPVVVPERYHPELRLMSKSGREFVSDAIEVEGYKDYHATAYRLEYSLKGPMFFLMAPKGIVVARPRDLDDHIDWLLEKHKFAEALMECEHETKKYARIVEIYLNDLISKQEYTKAVRVCVETFGSDPELWEKWIITFTEHGQLARLVDYIPTRNPTLKTVTYTNVILYFLRCDPDRCLQLISAWESLFDVKEIFIAMKTITPTEKHKLGIAQVEHLNGTVSELKTQKELVANLQQALKEEAAKSKTYQADVAELQQHNERLQREKRETEAALCEERICVA